MSWTHQKYTLKISHMCILHTKRIVNLLSYTWYTPSVHWDNVPKNDQKTKALYTHTYTTLQKHTQNVRLYVLNDNERSGLQTWSSSTSNFRPVREEPRWSSPTWLTSWPGCSSYCWRGHRAGGAWLVIGWPACRPSCGRGSACSPWPGGRWCHCRSGWGMLGNVVRDETYARILCFMIQIIRIQVLLFFYTIWTSRS